MLKRLQNAQSRINTLDSQSRVGFSKWSNGQFCLQHSANSGVSHYLWSHSRARPAGQRTPTRNASGTNGPGGIGKWKWVAAAKRQHGQLDVTWRSRRRASITRAKRANSAPAPSMWNVTQRNSGRLSSLNCRMMS